MVKMVLEEIKTNPLTKAGDFAIKNADWAGLGYGFLDAFNYKWETIAQQLEELLSEPDIKAGIQKVNTRIVKHAIPKGAPYYILGLVLGEFDSTKRHGKALREAAVGWGIGDAAATFMYHGHHSDRPEASPSERNSERSFW